jgi:hypothetical protein
VYNYYPPFTINAENHSSIRAEIRRRERRERWRCCGLAVLNLTIGAVLLTLLQFHLIGWLVMGFFGLLAAANLFGLVVSRLPEEYIVYDKKCPRCGSYYFGRTILCRRGEDGSHYCGVMERYCPHCQCLTVDNPYIPDNDNPPVSVKPNHAHWVKCPCCQKHFAVEYGGSWNGERHTTCGQRLLIQRA